MKRARIHRFADGGGGTSVQANPSDDALTELTKLKVGTTTFGIRAVDANPSSSAAEDLTKLTVGDTTYGIPAVEANPSSSATEDLTKLTVGSTTYSLESTLDVTYGGTSPLTLDFASHVHPNISGSPAGVFFFAGGLQVKTNFTRASGSERPLNLLFDGNLAIGTGDFQAIGNTDPPDSGGVYTSGHYAWIDFQFDRPTRVTNIKMYTINGYDHFFPRQFKWQGHRGNQPNASQMTVNGNYVQPNANDEAQWTNITSTFHGTITDSGSDTVAGATATYNQSVSNTTYWDRIRLRVVQGSEQYGSDYALGEIQITGKRLL